MQWWLEMLERMLQSYNGSGQGWFDSWERYARMGETAIPGVPAKDGWFQSLGWVDHWMKQQNGGGGGVGLWAIY